MGDVEADDDRGDGEAMDGIRLERAPLTEPETHPDLTVQMGAAPCDHRAPQRGRDPDGARVIGFLMIPDMALHAFGGAVDVLRHANRFAGRQAYRVRLFSESGQPVRASNGVSIEADAGLDDPTSQGLDRLFVVCGFHPERVTGERVLTWLRRLARAGVSLGGISAGAFVLARAGLLNDRDCAVHWEYAAAFAEMWPEARLTDRLYVLEPDRATCAGGSATIDMLLRIVASEVDPAIAEMAAEQMLVERVRDDGDRQTSAALAKARSRSPALALAIAAMETRLDTPMTMREIADRSGLTRRQLHRLFREHTGRAPTDFYRDLRLRHARALLRRTPAKVIDVALSAGFSSHSHFSKVYREHFGVSPLADRRGAL